MFENDKQKFMRLLEENLPEVQRKILNLDNYVLREDYINLQEKFERLSEKNISLQEKYSQADLQVKNLQAQLKIAEQLSAECEYYRKNFAELDLIYKKYIALNENIRYQLAGIFGNGESLQGFLVGAANEKHLNEFWNFLSYSLNESKFSTADEKILSEIFDFAFDALNNSSREKIYYRLNTKIGSRFDSQSMIRTYDSKQLGTVQKILLEGYSNRAGQIIKQSLVFIGD